MLHIFSFNQTQMRLGIYTTLLLKLEYLDTAVNKSHGCSCLLTLSKDSHFFHNFVTAMHLLTTPSRCSASGIKNVSMLSALKAASISYEVRPDLFVSKCQRSQAETFLSSETVRSVNTPKFRKLSIKHKGERKDVFNLKF